MNSRRTDLELHEWLSQSIEAYDGQLDALAMAFGCEPDIWKSHLNGINIGLALARIEIARAAVSGAIPATTVPAIRRALHRASEQTHPKQTYAAFQARLDALKPADDTSPAS